MMTAEQFTVIAKTDQALAALRDASVDVDAAVCDLAFALGNSVDAAIACQEYVPGMTHGEVTAAVVRHVRRVIAYAHEVIEGYEHE